MDMYFGDLLMDERLMSEREMSSAFESLFEAQATELGPCLCPLSASTSRDQTAALALIYLGYLRAAKMR